MKIGDLFREEINRHIRTVKATEHRDPKSDLVQDGKVKRKNNFEKEVFSYLFEHKKEQEIAEIYSFENMLIDGTLKLNNGKVIALEIKRSLNWLRTCNARVQIQRLLKDQKKWDYFLGLGFKKLDGALIVFKDFSADWRLKRSSHERELGWYHFYEEEVLVGVPTVPLRIAQLTNERLEFGILPKEN